MPDFADETAYYFNKKIPAVALISNGVRFPAGTWMRFVNAAVSAPQVEEMLARVFPELKGKFLTFVTLTSEAEVAAFEASIRQP
jgi:hypothetical protein